MTPIRPLLLAALLALPACTATTPGSTEGAERQLRAGVEGPLRRAGISQACIDSLDVTALTHLTGLTNRSPRTSREVLKQRQQLRTFVGQRYCPDL